MKLKSLKTANKIYEQIQQLDKEIIAIEKLAMGIANNPHELSITLKAVDLSEKAKKESKCEFDEDGSIRRDISNPFGFSFLLGGSCFTDRPKKDDEKESKHKFDLDDKVALEVLGVLIMNRNAQRNDLLSKLKRYGIID